MKLNENEAIKIIEYLEVIRIVRTINFRYGDIYMSAIGLYRLVVFLKMRRSLATRLGHVYIE